MEWIHGIPKQTFSRPEYVKMQGPPMGDGEGPGGKLSGAAVEDHASLGAEQKTITLPSGGTLTVNPA